MLHEYQIEYRNGKPVAYATKPKYLLVNSRNSFTAQQGAQAMLDSEGWMVTVTTVRKNGQAFSDHVPTV